MLKNRLAAMTALFLVLSLAGCGRSQTAAEGGANDGSGASAQQMPAAANMPGRREYEAALRDYRLNDRAAALQGFIAAGNQGNAYAQYYAGVMFADGQATERSYDEAVKWYEKAAAQNHPDALFALARLHVFGLGVEMDAAKAVELYERAAKAYPPGEQRERAEQQRLALIAALEDTQTSTAAADQ